MQPFTLSAAPGKAPGTGKSPGGEKMPVRKIHRLCFSDNADLCAKGLLDLARRLGTDSVTNELPTDYAEKRAELAEKGMEPRLLDLAASENAVHRELAIAALGAWRGDKARAAVLKATEDNALMVRQTAVGALESWPDDEEAYEVLLTAIEDGKWAIRWHAARGLRSFSGADAEAALLEALLDPNANVRQMAATSLQERDAATILPMLRDLFDHPAPHLFDALFELFGEIGTAEDGKTLEKVGSFFNFSQPGHVRRGARGAAKKIKARLAGKPVAN